MEISQMSKNDNMLAILWMLNSSKKITAKQIAEKLELIFEQFTVILILLAQVAYQLFQIPVIMVGIL